ATTALISAAETLMDVSRVNDISPGAQPAQISVLEEAGYFMGALNNAPSTFRLELLRGKWSLSRRALAQARPAFQAALRLVNDSPEAREGLATVAFLQGDLPEAEKQLQPMLLRAPVHPPALQIMALIESTRQKWTDAVNWQSRYIVTLTKPSANAYVQLG